MEYQREDWSTYKNRLIFYGYSDEQLAEIEKIRNSEEFEHMTFEQFDLLFRQGIIKRTAKLKKKRNLFTNGDTVLYLSHYHKAYVNCGYFINEEE
jgi:adenylate cyclase class IV